MIEKAQIIAIHDYLVKKYEEPLAFATMVPLKQQSHALFPVSGILNIIPVLPKKLRP